MPLFDLPPELILLVATLQGESDINALSQTNRQLHHLLNQPLYRHNSLNSGSSALLWAAANGKTTTAQLSIQERGNVMAADSEGLTPLSLAAKNGHEPVAKMLLVTGHVDVNSKDSEGYTPLCLAAENGHSAVVKLLLQRQGVDVNAQESDGCTPLFLAASENREEVVRLLLETRRVDVNRPYNKTPLYIAAYHGYLTVMKLLIETGRADVNAATRMGRTPLHVAIMHADEAVAKLLLETGRVDLKQEYIQIEKRRYKHGGIRLLLREAQYLQSLELTQTLRRNG